MKNSQSQKKLQIILLVLVGVLTLGIGYASITAVNLIINGNATASVSQDNFKVYFTTSNMKSGTGTTSINENDDTIAYFNITGLSKAGDTAVAEYTILNDSNAVGAEISLELTNSNPEYFKVTEKIEDNLLQAGEDTTATITVEMIKTPIDTEETTSISGKLIATPKENAEASGGEAKEVIKPTPYTYTLEGYNGVYTNMNQSLPNNTRTFTNFAAAKAEYGQPGAIAHIIEDGIIKESYVAFEKDNKIYYLRGGINEESLTNSPIYNLNVETLKEAFGDNWSDYCAEHNDPTQKYFYCSDGVWTAHAFTNGAVTAQSGFDCHIYNTGNSMCFRW